MTHDELMGALEKATGPSRELNVAIAVASGQYIADRHRAGMFFRADDCTRSGYAVPAYSASIDAALTLVPDLYDWRVSRFGDCWVKDDEGFEWCVKSNTPALAICIAALRARGGSHG